jgi:hypothetical protein
MAQVNFDVPQNMAKEAVYTFNIVRSSLDGQTAANNVQTQSQTDVSADGDSTTIAQTTLKGNATSAVSKEVINYSFRTSKYNTFIEKMSATSDPRDLFDVATNYISVIGQRFDASESFDKFETEGDNTFSTKPLISLVAGTNNSWLQNQLMPLIYTGYPFNPGMIITRDQTTTGGIPPLDAVRLYNANTSGYRLEDAAISEGLAPTIQDRCRFMYYVSFVANDDYHELLNKANRLYINGVTATPAISRLLTSTYPDLQGNIYYPVELKYRLPGSNNISSSVTRSIYYKL